MNNVKICIDTDPGIDDALALLSAFQLFDGQIVGITSVAGNQSVEKTTANAAKLLDLANQTIPLYRGAEGPLARTSILAEEVHGITGIGKVVLPQSRRTIEKSPADEAIYKMACEYNGQFEIITLGPLTNIALSLMKHRDLAAKIKKITMMGGGSYAGNVTPYAEFNFFADAEAADIVFRSGIPIVMVGLDATHNATITKTEATDALNEENYTQFIALELFESLFENHLYHSVNTSYMHDPLAVAAHYDPSLVSLSDAYVSIVCEPNEHYGQSLVEFYHESPNAKVALDCDLDRFRELLFSTLTSYREH